MANRYGEAAILAARQANTPGLTPKERWESAMEKLYPTSPAARRKGSPRGAFLGLCEEGLVQGIPAGRYSPPNDSKAYAVQAVALLKGAAQHWSRTALWQEVSKGSGKEHDSQIDVVLALWNKDLIVRKG